MREELQLRITEKVKNRRAQLYHKMIRLVSEHEVPTGETWPGDGSTGFELIKKISERGMSQEITKEVDAALSKIVDRLERDILCDQTTTTDGNQT